MEATAVAWTPLEAVIAASLVVGAITVWRVYAAFRKRSRNPEASPFERRELLLRRRDTLVQQLREERDTDAERTPEQLAQERLGTELRDVLRELDRLGASRASTRPRRAGAGATPGLRGFLWGAASMAAAGFLLFLVYTSVSQTGRGGSVLRETPVGRVDSRSDGVDPPAADAARQAQLKAAVARNPEDVEARLELARVYLIKKDLKAAWEETREVLKRSPDDPRGLTYLGVIRSTSGQPEIAVTLFQRAIAKQPDLLEAHLQLAHAYVRLDREPDAEAALAAASRRFPEKAAMLDRLLDRWRRQAGQELAAGSPTEIP